MPTATESIDPGQVLGDLERLKDGLATALSREEELDRVREQERVQRSREITAQEKRDAEILESRVAEQVVIQNDIIGQQQMAYELRLARIRQAYHSSRSTLAERMQVVKETRIRSGHGSLVASRQRRAQELAEAGEAHQAFKALLAADLESRTTLRSSARSALRSYRALLLREMDRSDKSIPTDDLSPEELRTRLQADLKAMDEAVNAAQRQPLAKLFRFLPLSLLVAVIGAAMIWQASHSPGGLASGWPRIAIAEGVLLFFWLVGLVMALPSGKEINRSLRSALTHAQAARKASSARLAALHAKFDQDEKEQSQEITGLFNEADTELKSLMAQGLKKLEQQQARLPGKLEKLHQRKLSQLNEIHSQAVDAIRAEADSIAEMRQQARRQADLDTHAVMDAALESFQGPWQSEMAPIHERLMKLDARAAALFPNWTHDICASWSPPQEAPQSVRIGELEVDLSAMHGSLPRDRRLSLPEPSRFTVPLALGFPERGSLLIETTDDSSAAVDALNGIALRLLASFPPGRASFVFIDPVGLGRGFAGLMHLSDYEETLITNRIWTQTTHIEERLAELSDHIEKVIQMYLRNEYATIADYNEQAGSVAEKYRFLVIAGLPSAFSESGAKRLLSIASSGARCGVHLLIQCDARQSVIDHALYDELRRACLKVTFDKGIFHLTDAPQGASTIRFDQAPHDDDASVLIHRIGRASTDSNRVEVPFSHIAPPAGERWTSDTSDELRVPIGRAGAKKLQMLALGKGTRQHMLVAGKTGSGKSTLFHVIITNLALWCSPEQVEFYLVDFKKGVEFKCYASKQLPHARVVAIESDREFALSVLQQVDAELKRRGELFRRAGSQDLPSYNRSAEKRMPRTLLLIDEFQEFFTEDDSVAQEASLLLDRIVRQGRAFGIHVILGSQTLGGAYTLARATLGQMVIRVALQCNEADAHLIMDEDNPAPRLLTRPGEGIYNDQAGALAANSPFQIVWLPEQERDAILDDVAALASAGGKTAPVPVVFEGNAPAEIRENVELAAFIGMTPATRPASARAWLGAPNSIKGPTAAVFQRQSGSHLLTVGQSSERTASLLLVSILSLAAQYAPDQAEFVILDPQAADESADSPFRELSSLLPHRVRIGGPSDVADLMADLSTTMEARNSGASSGAEIFLLIHDLQRFKSLRPDDDFRFSLDDDSSAPKPSQAFANLLNEGGPVGMHLLASTDTWNNVSRWIPRKLLAEFEMRVLFQMSANDSANLIDSPAAANLGLHRALFHNEHLGSAETFRPYAMPDETWVGEMAGRLKA